MYKPKSNFKAGLDSYCVWTKCVSFQSQYKTFIKFQVTHKIIAHCLVSSTANPPIVN